MANTQNILLLNICWKSEYSKLSCGIFWISQIFWNTLIFKIFHTKYFEYSDFQEVFNTVYFENQHFPPVLPFLFLNVVTYAILRKCAKFHWFIPSITLKNDVYSYFSIAYLVMIPMVCSCDDFITGTNDIGISQVLLGIEPWNFACILISW